MNLKMEYDYKNNTGSIICPNCGKKIIGYPAISRKDNKIKICSNCGTMKAIEDFLKLIKKEK